MNRTWKTAGLLAMALAATATAQAQTATTAAPIAIAVVPAVNTTLIKIDGRMYTSMVVTGRDGTYSNRSVIIPDAKLRLTISPSNNVTIVNRFDTKNANTNGFDYFYMDIKNYDGAKSGNVIRLGKMKADFGEETWTDNPVENNLVSNSVASVGSYDEGVNFRGTIAGAKPVNYSFALLNASKDVSVSANGMATASKLSVAPTKDLYVSGSYYQTGDLVKADGSIADSDLKIAGLQKAPTGATSWSRNIWEADVRWNYGSTGQKPAIGGKFTAPLQLAAAYGSFTDNATGAADRKGDYWYAEGLYNVNAKLYLATRYSVVTLQDGATEKLADSPVAVNEYRRLSVGGGYRMSDMTQLKLEVSNNDARDSGKYLNQYSLGVATKF